MEIRIGILVNVRFYYGAISNEQRNKDMVYPFKLAVNEMWRTGLMKCEEPVVQHSTVISWRFVVCRFQMALARRSFSDYERLRFVVCRFQMALARHSFSDYERL